MRKLAPILVCCIFLCSIVHAWDFNRHWPRIRRHMLMASASTNAVTWVENNTNAIQYMYTRTSDWNTAFSWLDSNTNYIQDHTSEWDNAYTWVTNHTHPDLSDTLTNLYSIYMDVDGIGAGDVEGIFLSNGNRQVTFAINAEGGDPERLDIGWGGSGGGNFELYSVDHATRPGDFRVVFGGSVYGDVIFYHYDGGANWYAYAGIVSNAAFYCGHVDWTPPAVTNPFTVFGLNDETNFYVTANGFACATNGYMVDEAVILHGTVATNLTGIYLAEIAAPAAPAADTVVIYVDSADGDLKAKDDDNEVKVLADFAVD